MKSYLFLLSDLLFWFGDNLLLLSEDHLNVAGGAHVGVDASVGTVGTPAHLRGLVHLDMLNHQRVHIQTLGKETTESALSLHLKKKNVLHFAIVQCSAAWCSS